MSGIDIALAIFILIGAIQGYRAGFLLELFALIAVILGVLGGFKLMGFAMVLLDKKINVDEKVLPYIAFGFIFVLIVIAVNLLGRMLKASVSKTFLGGVDQAAGALLGLVRTAFMFSVILWIVDSLKFQLLPQWTENSWLYPSIAGFAPKMTNWIGDVIPFFRDIF